MLHAQQPAIFVQIWQLFMAFKDGKKIMDGPYFLNIFALRHQLRLFALGSKKGMVVIKAMRLRVQATAN